MSTIRLISRFTGRSAFNHGLLQKQQRLQQHSIGRCWRPTSLLATSYAIPEQHVQPTRDYYSMHNTDYSKIYHERKNSLLIAQSLNPLHSLTFSTDSKPDKSGSKPPKPTLSESEIFGEASNLSTFAKFKLMFKKYWYVLVPVHVVTSIFWFGGFYYMSKSGVDIASLMEYIHLSESIIEKIHRSDMGHLAVAYLCYKISMPVRDAVTLGGTTLAIKYLVQSGHIKPMPSKQDIIKMYEQKKADLIANKADKVKAAKEVLGTNKIETTKHTSAVSASTTPPAMTPPPTSTPPPPPSVLPKAEKRK